MGKGVVGKGRKRSTKLEKQWRSAENVSVDKNMHSLRHKDIHLTHRITNTCQHISH